ncbi:hypothetical protein M501DRAFT_934655 [Patellaria atrata CBS 101060]|uniref:Uncharacterized protein n=1 Tax=Patellaria atrata CBS 101060 TaxID=1346257 RepID=A0A9P4S9V1_9PEZI|nr:hypothetical protein M501DRAFT_934655 [Patellaria atrata CBS 101060]
MTLSAPPIHPVACMQGPFDESMAESTQGPDDSAKSVKETEDPKLRRQKVLEDEEYSSSYNAQWRHNPKSKYHPLWKIIAQICFGIHLMHQRLAKSDDEVLKILQLHVDEIDTFLRTTTQDFDLAMEDIKERLSYLKLPLEHVNIFDTMLDDRQFRASIVDGNEKIERIIERTARAMNDSLVDVEKGIEATTELSAYLENIRGGFAEGQEEWTSIYTAMRGNAEGWYRCFRSLQVKGNSLGVALVQLGSIVNEMSKRAGVASRRSIVRTHINCRCISS